MRCGTHSKESHTWDLKRSLPFNETETEENSHSGTIASPSNVVTVWNHLKLRISPEVARMTHLAPRWHTQL